MEIVQQFNEFLVRLYDDKEFRQDSSDNIRKYKHVYAGEPGIRPSSQHAIRTAKAGKEISSAILMGSTGATGIHDHAYVLQNESIYVCVSNYLYCLDLPELTMNWRTTVDDFTNFGIYPLHGDFIIHGECLISRVTNTGRIVWQQGGSDIFVRHSGRSSFKIRKNTIYARSWDGRRYRIDFDGRLTAKNVRL
jgi:outer membrane protein assembly factor BamB